MNRTPVSSSHVASVGYDGLATTLEVAFRDGSVYQYYAVPSDIAGHLVRATSVGSYLNAHVKGIYRYKRIA